MSRKDGLLTSVNWNERGDLNIHNDLLLLLRRLVIPETLRHNVITYLHDTHQSITKTLENSASSVWWPGLSRDIQKMVQDCDMWSNLQTEKIERMRGTPYPNRPWGKVAADSSVHKGHNYPLVVDYYSRDVEICLVHTPSKRVFSCITEHESHTKNSSARHPDELLPKMPDYDELCRREKKYREKMAQAFGMTTDTKLY